MILAIAFPLGWVPFPAVWKRIPSNHGGGPEWLTNPILFGVNSGSIQMLTKHSVIRASLFRSRFGIHQIWLPLSATRDTHKPALCVRFYCSYPSRGSFSINSYSGQLLRPQGDSLWCGIQPKPLTQLLMRKRTKREFNHFYHLNIYYFISQRRT